MWPFKSKELPYTKPNRLADVLALIQVLALAKYRHRSDNGLTNTMQGAPRSGSSWKEIAQQHPEFFRVDDADQFAISLVSTHVLPKDANGNRELPSDFLSILFQTAINLHDREQNRAHHWNVYIPIVVAIVAGFFTIFGILLRSWFLDP